MSFSIARGVRSLSQERKWLLVVLAVSVPALFVVFIAPLEVDAMLYQSIALDYIRYGKIFYLGAWDHNFPGILLFHYAAIKLFGSSDVGFRLFDVILQFAFVAFFYRFLLRWLRPAVAATAAILYVLYYSSSYSMVYGERDVYGAMLLVVALFFLYDANRLTPVRLAIAGLATGYSIVLRPTSLLYFALLVWFVVATERQFRWKTAGLFSFFSILPTAILLVFYGMKPGGLEAFYLAAIRFNLDVYAKIHSPFSLFVRIMRGRGLLLPLAVLGTISWSGMNRFWPHHRALLRSERILYIALVGSSIGVVLLQQKYLAYHFAPFFVLIIPFAALGVRRIVDRIPWSALRIPALALALFLSSFVSYHVRSPLVFLDALRHGRDPFQSVYDSAYDHPGLGGPMERRTISYLNEPANREGLVEVLSYYPALRLHLNREAAGPYILPTALAYPMTAARGSEAQFTDYQERWREVYIDTLRARKPRFLVLCRMTDYWDLVDPYNSWLHYMPGFDQLLLTSYRYDTTFGYYQVYRRIE